MNTLPSLFQSSLLLYVPLGVFLTFGLLMTAGLQVTGAKAEGVAKSVACVLLKTLGLLLVSLSSVQLMYGVITMSLPQTDTLLALILIFTIGAGILTHESRMIMNVDEASASVANAVFCHSCRVIGCMIAIVAGLSLLMTFVLTQSIDGAEMPVTLLILGSLLSLTASVHGNGGVKRKTAKKKK